MNRQESYPDYLNRLFPSGVAQKGRLNLARSVTFQVTDACSLRCSYCYQGVKGSHIMPFSVAKKFVDLLLDGDNPYINLENSPGVVIEFIGGEPFLEIELVDRITDYFINEMIRRRHPWAARFRISISSNGTEYFNPKVQAYLKKHRNHLSFSISIDGNKQLHDACRVFPDGRGSYDTAIAGVKHYTEVLGGLMGSKMTLAPANIGYTFAALKNLVELGYKEINLNCVYEEGWTLEHARTLYQQLKLCADYLIGNALDEIFVSIFQEDFFRPKSSDDIQNWCGGNGEMISVDYTGNIYPCIRYMPNSLGPGVKPLVIGHVDHGILGTQEEKDCAHCLHCVDRRTQSTDQCFFCPIAEGCAWCTAYNYQVFGTPDRRATFICVMHKARALANAYYWNRLYRSRGQGKRFRIHIPEDWALEIISPEEWKKLKKMEEC